MAAYGEFTPTDDQKAIALAAAEIRQSWTGPWDFRIRFILPGQPEHRVTWRRDITDEELSGAEIKTGLAWIEDAPLARTLGFDWMLRVQAKGEDFLVRNGRFFKVVKSPSDSDAVGQSDGTPAG